MHKHAYTHVYTRIYMHAYTYTYTYADIYIYVYSYTHIHTHIYAHTYNMYMCTYTSTPGTLALQRLREKPDLTPRKLRTFPLEAVVPPPFDEIGSTRNERNQQQLITSSRQSTAQTTTAHLHWCRADLPSSWPGQAASHGGDPPKRGYVSAIFTRIT